MAMDDAAEFGAPVRVHLVAVGTEVTSGLIGDGNGRWLAAELSGLGAEVLGLAAVPDRLDRVAETLRRCLAEADLVVATGGLGPTADDLTREALAVATGRRLVRDAAAAQALRDWYRRAERPMPAENLRQADLPEGAEMLDNPRGTAPGVSLTLPDGRRAVLLPGPPSEMRPMAERFLLTPLRQGPARGLSRILRVTGVGESQVEAWLADLMGDATPSLRPYAKDVEVHLRLAARGRPEEAERLLDGLEARVRSRLGPAVYGTDNQTLEQATLAALERADATVAVAESVTGGEVAARLTRPAGASARVRGSAVVYGEGAKAQLLGLDPAEVAGERAVRPAVAALLADAARRKLGASYGLGLTGYAGPTAGNAEPVGRVYVAVALPDGRILPCQATLSGLRDQVRERAAQLAIDLVRRAALSLPVPPDQRPDRWVEAGSAPA
jgi:nicotinamide-nucleotide amidase